MDDRKKDLLLQGNNIYYVSRIFKLTYKVNTHAGIIFFAAISLNSVNLMKKTQKLFNGRVTLRIGEKKVIIKEVSLRFL